MFFREKGGGGVVPCLSEIRVCFCVFAFGTFLAPLSTFTPKFIVDFFFKLNLLHYSLYIKISTRQTRRLNDARDCHRKIYNAIISILL